MRGGGENKTGLVDKICLHVLSHNVFRNADGGKLYNCSTIIFVAALIVSRHYYCIIAVIL